MATLRLLGAEHQARPPPAVAAAQAKAAAAFAATGTAGAGVTAGAGRAAEEGLSPQAAAFQAASASRRTCALLRATFQAKDPAYFVMRYNDPEGYLSSFGGDNGSVNDEVLKARRDKRDKVSLRSWAFAEVARAATRLP